MNNYTNFNHTNKTPSPTQPKSPVRYSLDDEDLAVLYYDKENGELVCLDYVQHEKKIYARVESCASACLKIGNIIFEFCRSEKFKDQDELIEAQKKALSISVAALVEMKKMN